jgi:hypothetical protein
MVGVASHFEEGELPGRFLWNETANYYESLGCSPSPWFVFKLRNPKPRRDFLVVKAPKVVLDRFGDPSHNGIEGRNSLEKLHDRMIVECRVTPHTNLSDPGGQFRNTPLQKLYGMGSGMDIARQIDSLPDISCFPFETEEGLIGRPSSFLWIVANSGSLLLTIDSKDFGIEIEYCRREGIGFHQKMNSESVVKV